jgi:hypothetical protein
MPDRSKVMTQTKRDALVFQVAGLGVGLITPPHKNVLLRSSKIGNRTTILEEAKVQ